MGKSIFFELREQSSSVNKISVMLEVHEDNAPGHSKTPGMLIPSLELTTAHSHWREVYFGSTSNSRNRLTGRNITYDTSEVIAKSKHLSICLNAWLNSGDISFQPVRDKLIETIHQTNKNDEIRLIIQTDLEELYRLPWHLWNIFDTFQNLEIAISPLSSDRPSKKFSAREKIRILAVLGNKTGIRLQKDKEFLSRLPKEEAEVTILAQKPSPLFYEALREKKGWDILFFGGHSYSEGSTGILSLNDTETITIPELKYALRAAIEGGLKLAIFNSCNGMSLTWDLIKLQLPHIVIFREPVPDKVAYEFFGHFLSNFAGLDGEEPKSLYLSVRDARHKLHDLEREFPCASWLPVICHNPAEPPLTWHMLRNIDASPLEIRQAESSSESVVPSDGTEYIQSPCPITAIRFIPFYLGSVSFSQQKDDYLGFSSCVFEHVRIIPFDDGMHIIVLEEALQSKDIVDFLRQRRRSHLSFLSQNNEILNELREIQEITPSNPLIFELPNLFPYVMSIHHLENGYVSRKNVQYMTEPAILGITDDPLASATFLALQENSFIADESKVNSIHELTSGHTDFYISWSNVVATFSSRNQSQMDLNRLIYYEIVLQKLWYKLFLYAENMSLIDRYLDCLDVKQLKLMKQEVFRTKMEYATFIRPDARASSCMNDLKQKLILTSKISELFQNFSDQSNLLNDLEQSL